MQFIFLIIYAYKYIILYFIILALKTIKLSNHLGKSNSITLLIESKNALNFIFFWPTRFYLFKIEIIVHYINIIIFKLNCYKNLKADKK